MSFIAKHSILQKALNLRLARVRQLEVNSLPKAATQDRFVLAELEPASHLISNVRVTPLGHCTLL